MLIWKDSLIHQLWAEKEEDSGGILMEAQKGLRKENIRK